MSKRKFTDEEMIEAIQNAKGIQTVAAKMLDTTRQTVANYIKRSEAVRDAYDVANESALDFAENALFKQIERGNIAAIIFYLKTKGKHRGFVERQELTGRDGKSIDIEASHLTIVEYGDKDED